MIKHFTLKATLITATVLALPMAWATTMAKADYKIGKERIAATYKTDKTACDAFKDNAKDVCVEEAKAKEKVGKAELEFSYTGKAKDGTKVLVAKAEAAYDVAKERCDDQAGNAKDVCVKEAKALEVKALANAKLGQDIRMATKDATTDMNDADYKVAIEKCDALAGDAKGTCVAAAKTRFKKN